MIGMALVAGATANPQRCASCRQALGARYWTFEGSSDAYCDTCIRTNPKCYGCGKPLAQGSIEVRGESLCRECTATRPKCGDCRSPILKKYFQVTGIEEVYCDHCFLYHPHCRFCGRPFQEEGTPAAAAGPVCKECKSEAVTDLKQIEAWIREIRTWMGVDLGMNVDVSLRFRVDDEIEGGIEKRKFESYQELGAFVVEGERKSVILVRGLPKVRLIETIAHELAHAWQWEEGIRDQLLEHKEGFAQWVAGKALQKFGYGAEIHVLKERPDLYGKGYRLFDKIEREEGIHAVFSYAKSAH